MTLLGWGDEHGVKTGPLLPYTNEKGKKSHASCNAFDLWCCYICTLAAEDLIQLHLRNFEGQTLTASLDNPSQCLHGEKSSSSHLDVVLQQQVLRPSHYGILSGEKG